MAGVEFGRYRRLMQYFWDPKPFNDKSSQTSIWCLGKEYKSREYSVPDITTPSDLPPSGSKLDSLSCSQSASLPDKSSTSFDVEPNTLNPEYEEIEGWPLGFLDDFETRLSLTYRSGFPAIQRSRDIQYNSSLPLSVRLRSQLNEGAAFTSDTGWGCMIRTGQSLLANTLVLLKLGRDWRRNTADLEERKIISLFADDSRAPFSLHKFVEHGAAACGKHPGEWFGPSATARCIQALTSRYEPLNLCVYVTGDGLEVYEDQFMATAKSDGLNFIPTLILIGTRLGLEKITPVYWEAIKASLKMPQSLGIAGGLPSSSYYFVGVQDSHFFYLDPHNTQPALTFYDDIMKYTQEEINTCHTRRLRRIHIKEMDPSMLLAFLIRDESDWNHWRRTVQETDGKAVVRIINTDSTFQSSETGREEALCALETFDDEDNMSEIISTVSFEDG